MRSSCYNYYGNTASRSWKDFKQGDMRHLIKKITASAYKPLLQRYLSSTRHFTYRGLRLDIHPDVFHPGFFYSSKFLLRHLSRLELRGKSFLELGAGSGLISLYAAKEGAVVTASDINPTAVEYLNRNKAANGLPLQVMRSDLFSDIPRQRFDVIAINPPYYRGEPDSYAAFAWYSGKDREYFRSLFGALADYVHAGTIVCMVLCEGAEERAIEELGRNMGWHMHYVYAKRSLFEMNHIIYLKQTSKVHPVNPRTC